MDPVTKYLYHKFVNNPNRWDPFLSIFYLTYRCDFRCPYCSNGSGDPFYGLSHEVLPAGSVMEVLACIRQACDYIVITGGEPLKHPDFGEVIERIQTLKFRDVALNTNGYEVVQYLPQIARSVHTLIFSLDTLDEQKADAWFGAGRGVFQRIRANILQAAGYRGRKYRMVISSVVTARNIPDLYPVYDFAQQNGFTFAACPELKGVKPPDELRKSSAYRDFYDFLISEKKRGRSIHGSPLYLQHMRDFTKFSCRPFTMLVVGPLGQVFYPCLEIGHKAGNILDQTELHEVRRRAAERFGPQPDCDVQCHSACALGFSLILEHPLSMVREASIMLKTALQGRGRGSTRVAGFSEGGGGIL